MISRHWTGGDLAGANGIGKAAAMVFLTSIPGFAMMSGGSPR